MSARILVLPGTSEAGAPDHALAFELARRLAVTDATVTVLNLADYPLPLLDVGAVDFAPPPEAALRLATRIAAQDALLLVSPDANGSVPSLPKNAVDWAARVAHARTTRPLRVFEGLVVGLASASPGIAGDFPALTHWRGIFTALGAEVIEQQARFEAAVDRVDEEAFAHLDAFAADLAGAARMRGRRP